MPTRSPSYCPNGAGQVVEAPAPSAPSESVLKRPYGRAIAAGSLVAGMGGAAFWRWGGGWSGLETALFGWVLLYFAWFDFAQRRISTRPILWALAGVLLLRGMQAPELAPFFLLGSLSCYLLFWLLARVRTGALGQGDVRFAALVGAVLGFPTGLIALSVGMILAGLAAAALLASGQYSRHDTMAYAPYLAMGAWLALLLPIPIL